MHNITIKPATVTNVHNLQKINNESFVDNAKYDSDLVLDWADSQTGKDYFTKLVQDQTRLCLMAWDADKPVGYIACAPKTFGYRKSRYFEIADMGVIPDYRSQGIGQRLIKESTAYAKKLGYQKLFVNSYFQNTKAISFYKKCGFKEIDISLEQSIS